MQGATQAIEACGAVLAGGDVARAIAGAVIDVVVIGTTERPVLRSAAQIGDEVWVTGTLGGAAAAVSAWLTGSTPSAATRERYAHPVARIAEALWLREHIHALIDLSDGIAGDAGHLAAASGCRVVVDAEFLPLHADADTRLALQGGEDYELCLTAPGGALESVRGEFEQRFEIPLTKVGIVVAGQGVEVRNADVRGGFDHFAPRR
jgi:thiamine-monophosphate kinase